MYLKHKLGKYGEYLACKYLEKNGYTVLNRNFRCKFGEIDIIAKDQQKKELVFCEVKTRSNFHFGRPSQSVTPIKQKHILNVSEYYLYINNLDDIPLRFDVIEVYICNFSFQINHIKQII